MFGRGQFEGTGEAVPRLKIMSNPCFSTRPGDVPFGEGLTKGLLEKVSVKEQVGKWVPQNADVLHLASGSKELFC